MSETNSTQKLSSLPRLFYLENDSQDTETCDLTLVTGDGHRVRAHQLLFGAQSPLLKRCFLDPDFLRGDHYQAILLLPDYEERQVHAVMRLLLGEEVFSSLDVAEQNLAVALGLVNDKGERNTGLINEQIRPVKKEVCEYGAEYDPNMIECELGMSYNKLGADDDFKLEDDEVDMETFQEPLDSDFEELDYLTRKSVKMETLSDENFDPDDEPISDPEDCLSYDDETYTRTKRKLAKRGRVGRPKKDELGRSKDLSSRRHKDPKECPVCNKTFEKRSLPIHLKMKHMDYYKELKDKKKEDLELRKKKRIEEKQERDAAKTKEKKEPKPKNVVCEECGKVFSRSHIQWHMQSAHGHAKKPPKTNHDNNYKRDMCVKCGAKIGTHVYEKHVENCKGQLTFSREIEFTPHPTDPMRCPVEDCDWRGPNPAKHYRSTHNPKTCPECKKVVTGLYYPVHMLEFHNISNVYNTKYDRHKCQECGKAFTSKCYLERHMDEVHIREPKYHCDICGKSVFSKKMLSMHRYEKHLRNRKYYCEYCGIVMRSVKPLVAHMKEAHEFKPPPNYKPPVKTT